MDIVAKLMSALPQPVNTVTWLPRERSKLYPNGTAISTYGSFSEISDAITVVLNRYSWKNIGKPNPFSFKHFILSTDIHVLFTVHNTALLLF